LLALVRPAPWFSLDEFGLERRQRLFCSPRGARAAEFEDGFVASWKYVASRRYC